ncbi:MAG: sigma-70 family RNA polymerase sigma factor [Solirubrobacteraceae bacterium]
MERFDDNTLTVAVPVGTVAPAGRLPARPLSDTQFEFRSPARTRLSDDTLMALVAVGDTRAFAVLYERHVRAAAALAAQMCPRRVIAEEVVQEAFLSFWRSRRHFDAHRGSVRAWVLGIVRNRAIDVLRQGVVHQVADDSDRGVEDRFEACQLTDSEVGRRERARELLAALDDLPPEQSCVITLAYYGGYTHAEIAAMLDTPIGTVKGRMRLGLRKMAVSVPASI